MRNNSVKKIEFGPQVQEEMSCKDISYLELWRPSVWRRGTICAVLVEGIIRNNSVFIFRIWARAVLFNGAEPFMQF